MSSFSKPGGAQPAAVTTSITWSRSAKANIPGAFGTGFGRGGRCCAAANRHFHPRVFGQRTPAHERHARVRSGGAAHIGERRHPVAEEHHSEGRDQQIVFVQRGRGRIGLPPIDIGDAGGARAPFTLSKHWPGNVQPRHAAGGTYGARKFQRGRATATADIHHPFAGMRSGKDKQRGARRVTGNTPIGRPPP
jgi:hypothetical protein